jgi:hypothetical protein
MPMRPYRNIARIYIIFLLLTGSLLFASCFLLIHLRYDTLIEWIVSTMQKNGLEPFLRNRVFTAAKFVRVQKICFVLLFLIPVAVFALARLEQLAVRAIGYTIQSLLLNTKSLLSVFKSNTRNENWFFFGLLAAICARSLWYILHWDLQYDEMWSYNYFTAQPSYYSFFMCSNYPLYEILTGFFKWLPFPMRINLRLPVLIAGLLTCLVIYACVRSCFKSHLLAIAAVTGFAFFPVATSFMLYGRGVMLEIFFASSAIFSLAFWLREQQRNDRLVIFAIANIGGMYSMPTHFYLWILLMIIAAATARPSGKAMKRFLIANAIVVIGVLCCYAPILLGSGVSFFLDAAGNRASFPAAIAGMLPYLRRMSVFICGSGLGIYGMILTSIFLLYERKNPGSDYFLWVIIGICLLPPACYLIQGFLIPERAFGYVGLAIPLWIVLALDRAGSRFPVKSRYWAIALLAITGILVSHYHENINWSRDPDQKAIEISEILLKNHVGTCYDNSRADLFTYNYPAVEYYYRLEHKTIRFTVGSPNSIRYKPFSLSDQYDCIVLPESENGVELLKDYRLVYVAPRYHYKIWVSRRI